MGRVMNAVQAWLARRSHIAPISLVRIITYTDRTAETVDKVFYFADKAVEYNYGTTGTDQMFLPVVAGGSEFFSGFVHVPQPDDLTAFGKSFDLVCSNLPINGRRLISILREHNIEGARIEISQMLVPSIDSLPIDLTGYDGDEHTVLFRGRVNQIAPITNTALTIKCATELPSSAGLWNYAEDETKTDPQDLGKRLPRVYGNAKRVPCINYDVGSEFTFAEPLDASETGAGYEISDGSGLPAGVFNLRVDGEEMECQDAAAKTLKINTRGVGPTSGAAHSAGALAVELIATATYIVSDRQSSALDELYVINPLNGKLLRLNSGDTPWATNLADTIAAFPGETIATVKFTAAQLTTLIEYFEAQVEASAPASVSQQPVFTTPTTEVIRIPLTAAETTDPALEPSAIAGPLGSIATITHSASMDLRVTVHDDGANFEGISLWVPTGGAPDNTRTCKRFRVMVRNTNEESPTASYTIRLNFDFFGENGLISQVMDAGTDVLYGDIFASTWETPSGSPTLASMERSSAPSSGSDPNFLSVYLDAGGPTSIYGGIIIEDAWVECELDPIASPNPTEVEVSGGGGVSAGFGLRFFADLAGITGGLQAGAYSFDSGSWETAGCSVAYDAAIKQEGTNSLKVTIDMSEVGESEVISTDSLTNWTGTGAATALVDGEGHTEGSYAIEAVANGASAASLEHYDASLDIDLTLDVLDGYWLVFDIKVKHSGSTSNVNVRIGTDDSNYWERNIAIADFPENEWQTIIFPKSGGSGSPSPSNVDYFAVFWNDGGSPSADAAIYIDKIRTQWYPPTVQNNSIGNIDLDSDAYHCWFRQDTEPADDLLDNRQFTADIYITDSAGSGTTLPAAYRRVRFDPIPTGNDEVWLDEDDYAHPDTGVPDLTDVDTMHIKMFFGHLGAPMDRDTVIIRWIDFLRIDTVSYGAHPAGIILHHITETGGETVDSDSYDALVIALGVDAEWGFDLRSLGFTWEEILARMAYEARCNVVSVETVTGREWKLLSAGNGFGFGIPPDVARITQTHGLSDVGRSVDDLASHFSFRYGFDASLPGGGSEEGFKLALSATPSVSDVPISTALITAAEARFGAIESGPIALRCIQDPATAQDVAGYYVQERMANDRRVFQLDEVAWFDALPYDVGDPVRIVPPYLEIGTEVQILDCEDHASDFISSGSTLSDHGADKYEGAASMKMLINNASQNAIAGTTVDTIGTRNLVDRSIVVRCKVPTGDLALLKNIRMRISSTAGGASNWAEWAYYPDALVENSWLRLEFPIRLKHAWAAAGSVDLRNIINMWLRFQTLESDDGSTYLLWDDVRIEHQSVPCRITSMAKAFESNAWTITAVEVPEYGLRDL